MLQAAGEVYGERSILTTEVNELENRLISLSEERDNSLSVLDEVRAGHTIRSYLIYSVFLFCSFATPLIVNNTRY
jgi:hypothetical protein